MGRKTTKNRLADAHDALDGAHLRIAALERQRKDALLRDGDAADHAAERLDLELERLRRQARRCRDKIALLEPELLREEYEQRFPPHLGDAQSRLATLQRRRDALTRKNRFDRSAADDGEIDSLRSELEALTRHIEQCRLLGNGRLGDPPT